MTVQIQIHAPNLHRANYQYSCPLSIIVILESDLTNATQKSLRCKQVLPFHIPFSTNTEED